MKKIIESELISIAHRILKLKDKAEIEALYIESKNVFEKISVLKFYEDNKFRIDASITDEIIENALFTESPAPTEVKVSQKESIEVNYFQEEGKKQDMNESMEMDLINELVEDSKNSDMVSFDDEIEEEIITVPETLEEEVLNEEVHAGNVDEISEEIIESIDEDVEGFDAEDDTDEEEAEYFEADATAMEDELEEVETNNDFTDVDSQQDNEEDLSDEEFEKQLKQEIDSEMKVYQNPIGYVSSEADTENESSQVIEMQTIVIDPVYNLSLEEINFEQKHQESNYNSFTEDVIPEEEKHNNIENQHLMNSSEGNEVPFHQIPLNKTINDAFSKMITVGLNDRIAFEKNLFNGSSEDLNRVLSQLNTIETYQEAQDFIEDLVKPDFNYWKGKEEYSDRLMELIQKRFL